MVKLPKSIGFVSFWCGNLARQRTFFVDVLGLDPQHETEDVVVLWGQGTHYVLKLAVGATAHLDGSSQIGYFIDQLDDWTAHLNGLGVELLVQPTDIGDDQRMLVVKTPNGQTIAFAGQ